MRWFGNLKTQGKLLILFASITLVGALTTGWGIYNTIRLEANVFQIQQEWMALSSTAETQAHFLEQQISSKNLLLTDNLYYQSQFKSLGTQIEQNLRRALIDANTVDKREDLNSLDESNEDYTAAAEELVRALGTAELSEDEFTQLASQADSAAQRVQMQIKNMLFKRGLDLQALVTQSENQTQSTITIGAVGLLLFSALIVLAANLTNQISEPMQHLTSSVVAFENNTYEPGRLLKYAKRRDEMGHLVRAFSAMASSITDSVQEKDQLLTAATRFVPSQYLDFLEKESITDVKLGDHVSAEMAVMFSDIRSFTTMAEGMSPQQNFDFVNEYLQLVSPIIQKHDGFIVKFLGDGMMAVFPYGVDDAVRAGIEKHKQVLAFNADRQRRRLAPVNVGIGIHTGHMMVGMIGEAKRMQGDAFSDNVNLTSRIEGLTKLYGVSMIISEETRMRLEQPDSYQMRLLGRAQVKGREKPITLYDVFEGDPEHVRRQKRESKTDYERGLRHYMAGRFTEAKSCFEAVLDQQPDDQAAARYLERSTVLIGQVIPDDWNGVDVMTSK